MASQLATILVTDLVGSTDLRSRLGEEAADRLHRLHERLLRDVVEGHNGVVIKGLGDGVLASFSGAADAVAAAVAAQQAADSHSKRHPDEMLVLRVGLSAGDVTMEDDGDRIDTLVIEAARLCAAAAGGQILAAELEGSSPGDAAGSRSYPSATWSSRGCRNRWRWSRSPGSRPRTRRSPFRRCCPPVSPSGSPEGQQNWSSSTGLGRSRRPANDRPCSSPANLVSARPGWQPSSPGRCTTAEASSSTVGAKRA